MNKITRNIIIMGFASIGSGWLGVWVNNQLSQPHSLESPGALIWLMLPALSGIVLRLIGGDGWKDSGLRLHLKSGWKWYLLALLIYPLIILIVFPVAKMFGAISTSGMKTMGIAVYLSAAGIAAAGSLMKNIFEEFAWRGYLTPRLQNAGTPALLNHFIVGVIWWAWHIPYYYFLLDQEMLQAYITLDLNVFLILSFIILFPTAILFGELRLISKSVWPAFIFHCIVNGLSMTFLLGGFIELNGFAGSILSPTNEGIVVALLFGVAGFILYKYRMRIEKSQA